MSCDLKVMWLSWEVIWNLSVADHFTQVLHCEHECVRDLATRPGRLSPMENYLPLHYDYLQFAYFQGNCPHTWHLSEDLRCISQHRSSNYRSFTHTHVNQQMTAPFNNDLCLCVHVTTLIVCVVADEVVDKAPLDERFSMQTKLS